MKDTVLNNRNVATINKRIVDEIIYGLSVIDEDKIKTPSDLKSDYKKIHGNLVAITLRKYIQNIINYFGLNYKVSVVNSYIKGSPIEWDLLILKGNARGINDTNIYNVNDCVCILEIKKPGIYNMKDFKANIKKQINNINYIRKLTNTNLNFGYISFEETPNYFEITKEYFKELNESSDNVFTFVKYPYEAKLEFIDGCEDFEKYLFSILDKNNNGGTVWRIKK